jgi:hypothetical protein
MNTAITYNNQSFITLTSGCPAPCRQTRMTTTTCSTASSVRRLPGANAIILFYLTYKLECLFLVNLGWGGGGFCTTKHYRFCNVQKMDLLCIRQVLFDFASHFHCLRKTHEVNTEYVQYKYLMF